jgi:hypothetical protein
MALSGVSCVLLSRVRKETEFDRRRTVLKLFVGMVGATIKRWQVCTKEPGICVRTMSYLSSQMVHVATFGSS